MHNGNYNSYLISRFIDEIEDKNIVKNLLPTIGSFHDSDLDSEFWGYKKRGSFAKDKFDKYVSTKKGIKLDYGSSVGVSKIDLKKSIDTYKTGSNIVKASSLDYKIGDRVSHIKFGDGIVKNIDDVGRDYEVTVEFDEFGTKTLFAAFAKLEKI